jgi:hypothetical protein
MRSSQRELLFRFDRLKNDTADRACHLVRFTPDRLSLVATVTGDAEVFVTEEQLARFQPQLAEVST